MSEIDERIKLIEKNNLSQFQNLKKLANINELNNIKNLIKNNNILINDELNIIKKDMTFVKNEIQNLKSAKVNDINNTKIEIQKKNK